MGIGKEYATFGKMFARSQRRDHDPASDQSGKSRDNTVRNQFKLFEVETVMKDTVKRLIRKVDG